MGFCMGHLHSVLCECNEELREIKYPLNINSERTKNTSTQVLFLHCNYL